MASRSRVVRGRAGKARLTQWVGPADQGYVAVLTAAATAVAFVSFEEALTVMRTRGMVSIRPEVVGADLDIVGAVGVGIVSAEAQAIGITAIPTPFSNGDWGGWMVWRSFSYRFEFADATGVNFVNWNFEIDSKAMRKVTPNEALVIIAESQVGAYRISTPLRHLVKLS